MKYLICNLKSHKTYHEMLIYKDVLRNINFKNVNFILAPSNIYLTLFKSENINLCVQDLSLNNLELTGDTSIEQLLSLNVKYTLVGHYERRKYYNENETMILSKIKNALQKNIKIIYCIGETKEELARKVEYQALEKQIAKVFNNLPKESLKNIIIAYEPTYLIGTNNEVESSKIENMIDFIKILVNDYYQEKIKVVYGGNINTNNINNFKRIKNLDGFIIGNSALNPANIENLINNLTTE